MITVKANPNEYKAVIWKDNCSEVKRFCGDECTITYEVCAIDEYWSLKVHDCIKDRLVVVPLNSYIIKLGEHQFTVVPQGEFVKYFTEIHKDK